MVPSAATIACSAYAEIYVVQPAEGGQQSYILFRGPPLPLRSVGQPSYALALSFLNEANNGVRTRVGSWCSGRCVGWCLFIHPSPMSLLLDAPLRARSVGWIQMVVV